MVALTANLGEQVKRQNGSVAKLWERANETTERIASIETDLAAEKAARVAQEQAAEKASGQWERWVRPVVLAVLGAVIGWVARNPATVLKAVTQ